MKPAMQKTLESMNESLNEIQEWVARLIDADDDPYRELREAHERGALQVCDNPIYIGGLAMLPKIPAWVDRSKDCHMYWNMSPKCYRVKPECNCRVKPKTVKIYLWAYCVDGKWYQTNDYAETMVRGDMSSEVKRIDSTMIEVEA